jgi:phosphohistidine phosphatase SixA
MSIDKIAIARHVEYSEKAQGLTETGKAQATALSNQLRLFITVEPSKIKLLVTPAKRAWLTALVVAETLGITEVRSTTEIVTPHRDLVPMLTTQWPRSEKYHRWSATILIAHLGDVEDLPNRIGDIYGLDFPRYRNPANGFCVEIDILAQTCLPTA